MKITITLKNYRCFSDSKPAVIILQDGITAFVGANNAGKSTVLRFFYEWRPLFKALHDNPTGYVGRSDRTVEWHGVADTDQVFCKDNDRDIVLEIRPEGIMEDSDAPAHDVVKITVDRETKKCTLRCEDKSGKTLEERGGDSESIKGTAIRARTSFLQALCDPLCNILYAGSYRAITSGGSNSFDLALGQQFVAQWRKLKTGGQSSQNEISVKLEREIQALFNLQSLQINATEDGSSLQVIVNDSSFKIGELGSGLSHFILLLTQAAVARPSYILVDEPEAGLHASMQLSLVTSLASYATHGLMFATHSIGLARSAAEHIYAVHKETELTSVIHNYDQNVRLSELMGELTFSAYRELGFEQVLLVEGSTEIKTMQQFLRKYGEEHRCLLISLGGNDMIGGQREQELQELKRITTKIYALIDSERESSGASLSPDRETFQEVCRRNGIECHVLERRAIENYFSDKAIKKALGPKFSQLATFEQMKSWAKSSNWKIAREMGKDDFGGTDLGEFLKSIVTSKAGS
jgi:ABC-type Na+ transport system ATPase subunit NatA